MNIRNNKELKVVSLEEERGFTRKEYLFALEQATGKCPYCPRHGGENGKARSYYRSKEYEAAKPHFTRESIRFFTIE